METKYQYIIMMVTLIIFLVAARALPLQASPPDPESTFGWIEYLFHQGETEHTIHEGLKLIYFYPTHRHSDDVRMIVGKSYFKSKDYEKAVEIFTGVAKGGSKQDIREEAELWICSSLLKQGNLSDTRRRCDAFLSHYPGSSLKDKIQYQKAWSYLREWNWMAAEDVFRGIDPDSAIHSIAQEMIKETRAMSRQKEKSPLTAGLLSAFLPGSGYVYAGKWQTGIASFMVNGVFIAASIESFDKDLPILGSIIGLFETGWYSGTIYGSVNSAKQFNYKMREEKLQSLHQRFTIPLLNMTF